jgi:hypothetical protein
MENEKSIFHPWKPPFNYSIENGVICDSEGRLILEVEGTSFLMNETDGLGLGLEEALTIQDKIGQSIVNLMNAQTNEKTNNQTIEKMRKETNQVLDGCAKLLSIPKKKSK